MLINTNGISIDYRDQGAGVPVIFIHAFPLNQTMWDDQLAVLHNHCRTITLDLRGFGQSDAPQGSYLMDQMAADIRGLMSALGIDRAVLVGLSMGGYVSLAFYRNYPDSVRALVLADTRASADTHEARKRRLKSAERAEDTLTPVAEAESLRNGIRGARLRVIAGAGHLSNMESPEEFNTALIEFIEETVKAKSIGRQG